MDALVKDLIKDSRVSALTQLKISVKAANDLLFLKSHMPSYAIQAVPGRPNLLDIDLNNDGNFDVFSAAGIDVRLKERYLDNTDIIKKLSFQTILSLKKMVLILPILAMLLMVMVIIK